MQFFEELKMRCFSQISYLLTIRVKVAIRNSAQKNLTFLILDYCNAKATRPMVT